MKIILKLKDHSYNLNLSPFPYGVNLKAIFIMIRIKTNDLVIFYFAKSLKWADGADDQASHARSQIINPRAIKELLISISNIPANTPDCDV